MTCGALECTSYKRLAGDLDLKKEEMTETFDS